MQIEHLPINAQLPSPNGVALAVQALSKRENVTLGEIALVVQTDPALSGRLIKLANSASKFSRPVVSIQEAVVRQGLKAVCQLALGFSLLDQHRDGVCEAFDYSRYWSHSLLMGLAMKELGMRVRAGATDELFICGLLAQIGQLALANVYPEKYQAVLKAYQDNPRQTLAAHERVHLETDHLELGTAMMTDWGIPAVYTEPVARYENPDHAADVHDTRSSNLILMLRLAHELADIGLASANQRPQLVKSWLTLAAKLGIHPEEAGDLVHDVINEWHDWGTLLQIYTEPLPDFADLVNAGSGVAKLALPLRIVVADSNDFTRRKTMALLAESGRHSVLPATDGNSAMALALEEVPDVLIAHINLKQMDGLALCQALREACEGQGIYILLMDDSHSEELSILAFERGVDGYISSTISSRALHARLLAAQRLAHLKTMPQRDRARLGKTE